MNDATGTGLHPAKPRSGRELEKEVEKREAEEARPLRSRRTNSPSEAKREMERSRAEIQSTVDLLKTRVVDEVEDVKNRFDLPARLREAVRSDPLRMLAIAAGLGLGLALFTAGGKRGYDTLTRDEIEEIRSWRRERRRYLQRLETLLERSATADARPSLRQRVRARLRARREDED